MNIKSLLALFTCLNITTMAIAMEQENQLSSSNSLNPSSLFDDEDNDEHTSKNEKTADEADKESIFAWCNHQETVNVALPNNAENSENQDSQNDQTNDNNFDINQFLSEKMQVPQPSSFNGSAIKPTDEQNQVKKSDSKRQDHDPEGPYTDNNNNLTKSGKLLIENRLKIDADRGIFGIAPEDMEYLYRQTGVDSKKDGDNIILSYLQLCNYLARGTQDIKDITRNNKLALHCSTADTDDIKRIIALCSRNFRLLKSVVTGNVQYNLNNNINLCPISQSSAAPSSSTNAHINSSPSASSSQSKKTYILHNPIDRRKKKPRRKQQEEPFFMKNFSFDFECNPPNNTETANNSTNSTITNDSLSNEIPNQSSRHAPQMPQSNQPHKPSSDPAIDEGYIVIKNGLRLLTDKAKRLIENAVHKNEQTNEWFIQEGEKNNLYKLIHLTKITDQRTADFYLSYRLRAQVTPLVFVNEADRKKKRKRRCDAENHAGKDAQQNGNPALNDAFKMLTAHKKQ